MPLAKAEKTTLITENQVHAKDTGSPEVQVAVLTRRIIMLTDHFKVHGKDHASRRGLVKLLNLRRRLLDYLKTHHFDRYRAVLEKQGLRK